MSRPRFAKAMAVYAESHKVVMSKLLLTLVCAGASCVSGALCVDQAAEAAMNMDITVKNEKTTSTTEGALLPENDLVDVSVINLPNDTLCCCNELPSLTESAHSAVKHVGDKITKKPVVQQGRCVVAEVDGSNTKRQCRKMKFPLWAKTTPMHKASTLKIPCKIHKDEVQEFLSKYDQRGDYCKTVQPHLEVAGASSGRLGSETIPQCAIGYKNITDKMTCEFVSITEGAWQPAQNCQHDSAWCRGTLFKGNWEDVRLFDTALNDVSDVQCQPGHEPSHKQVRCTETQQFEPKPKCEPIKNYCSLDNLNSAQPRVDPSMIGESREVDCDVGYQASQQRVTCIGPGEKGHFDPTPSCKRATDWCKQVYVNKTFPERGGSVASELNGVSRVSCAKGWVPDVHEQTYCQPDHTYKPEPKCRKA